MKVWIDLSNSPHPLLFTPIRVAFERNGHTVFMTARDNAQTLELATQRWPDIKSIGGRSPSGRTAKARASASRAQDLFRWAKAIEPDVIHARNMDVAEPPLAELVDSLGVFANPALVHEVGDLLAADCL